MSTTENGSTNEPTVHLSIAERFLSASSRSSQLECPSISAETETPSLCYPLSQKSHDDTCSTKSQVCESCQDVNDCDSCNMCGSSEKSEDMYSCEYKCEYKLEYEYKCEYDYEYGYDGKKCDSCMSCKNKKGKKEKAKAMKTSIHKESIETADINVKQIDEQNDLEKNKKKSRYICRGKPLCAIISFVIIVMIAIAAFVLWPRTPLIRIDRATLLSDAKTTEMRHGSINLISYESGWKIKLIIDNRQNYITTRFNKIKITARDAMSGSNIGKGQEDSIMLPGNTISSIELPLHISYRTQDPYDTTIMYLQRACNNTKSSDSHIALSVHFSVTLYIFMLEQLNYVPTITAVPATGGFYCP